MNKESYEKLRNEKTILKGKVTMLTSAGLKDKDVGALGVTIDNDKNVILIPSYDLFLPKTYRLLRSLIGSTIEFRIKDIVESEEGLKVYGERTSVLKENREKFIKEISSNPDKVYDAVVKKVLDHGAYLMIDENDVFMYNSQFAEGYIPINAVKKPGDILKVKYNKYNEKSDIIYVKMENKYTEDVVLDLSTVKPQDIMKGIVRTKTSNLCFVNISPMIDVLCSPVEGINVGDEALIKITGFKEESDGRMRVRGKILVSKFSDDFRL